MDEDGLPLVGSGIDLAMVSIYLQVASYASGKLNLGEPDTIWTKPFKLERSDAWLMTQK